MEDKPKHKRNDLFLSQVLTICAVLIFSIPSLLYMNPTIFQWYLGLIAMLVFGYTLGSIFYLILKDYR